MNARRRLMAAMLACVPAASFGQDKKPDAKPQEIDKKTIAAWEKRGFEFGWVWAMRTWGLWTTPDAAALKLPRPPSVQTD